MTGVNKALHDHNGSWLEISMRKMNIDFDRLRKDLADDRYAAAFAGMPEFAMEAWEIEALSEEKLIELARREHIDLRKYAL